MRYCLLLLLCWIHLAVAAQADTTPIRGVWVTNVGSRALQSEQTIREAVALCRSKGINTIFVVVWNNGVTLYPSKLMQSYTGIKQDPLYKGFDPIQAMVTEAHRQGLKVHAWFEFGFSYAYGDSNTRWAQRYPHWLGRNNKGARLQKNGFYWWNALHPEVQQFMQQLVLEVVAQYAVDGVQGDDRLPAMPAEGGYDDYTRALYQQQTGRTPPQAYNDSAWLRWKADQLSNFARTLYQAVKKQRKDCLVSWAPSIYPWSREQYLQDWPAWLNGGYADYILPQLYRYNMDAYEKILKELDAQVSPAQKSRVFPGILSSLGNGYRVKPDLLRQMITLNRRYGFRGECLFYFETLREPGQLY